MDINDLIECLAAKGVKSIHIEMQPRVFSETVSIESKLGNMTTTETVRKETDTPLLRGHDVVGKHDVPVHRGSFDEPQPTPPIAPKTVVLVDQGKEILTKREEEELNVALSKKTDIEKVPEEKPQAAEKPVETKPEPKPAKAPREKKAAAEKPAEVKPTVDVPPKAKLYDAFCNAVSADDGTVTKEQRTAMIEAMDRDDLLRLNNDFQLGLDTDKARADLCAAVVECF